MATLSSAPVPEQRLSLNMLRFALEVAKQPTHDAKELRARTIKSLLVARDALKPIFGERGDWVQRLHQTLLATSKSLPSDDSPEVLLQQVAILVRALEVADGTSPTVGCSAPSLCPKTNSVFVIHGHDEENRMRLVEMLREDFKLNPIVILSKPGQSQTTIEKFEQHASSCSYAISLITPDDQVNNQISGSYPQARPNVLFETGWFAGRLGRERVLILLKEGTRIHSDFDGINQHRFRDNIIDKFRDVQRELEAAALIQRL